MNKQERLRKKTKSKVRRLNRKLDKSCRDSIDLTTEKVFYWARWPQLKIHALIDKAGKRVRFWNKVDWT